MEKTGHWSWLATNIHKEETMGWHFIADINTGFHCNWMIKRLHVVWKNMALVKKSAEVHTK